jgi:hypothetical protein
VKLLELRSIARRKEVSLTEDAVIGALEKSTKKGVGDSARSERSNVGERFQAPFLFGGNNLRLRFQTDVQHGNSEFAATKPCLHDSMH